MSMPVRLHRKIRFAIGEDRSPDSSSDGSNGFAAVPPVRGWDRFFEFQVSCTGDPDPQSGYLLNIKAIDTAVRRLIVPRLSQACLSRTSSAENLPEAILAHALAQLAEALPATIERVSLRLSPYYAVEMHTQPTNSPVATHPLLRLCFDFAAAHRLHVENWSEQKNRACFGKCNNPNGHGHNYKLEVAVQTSPTLAHPCDIQALEQIVTTHVIDRFDHTNLNLDTVEFGSEHGVIPSVENIARVCFELLADPVSTLGADIRLASVRVWETDRTSCEYPV